MSFTQTASQAQHIDWEMLRREAVRMSTRAYAPYSDFRVGAAALTSSGRIVRGCNVENAAYGVVLCAECGLVSDLVAGNEAETRELLVALSCVDCTGEPITPCGRCRQLLHEHAEPGMLIDMTPAPMTLDELLPHAFGAPNLDAATPPAHRPN